LLAFPDDWLARPGTVRIRSHLDQHVYFRHSAYSSRWLHCSRNLGQGNFRWSRPRKNGLIAVPMSSPSSERRTAVTSEENVRRIRSHFPDRIFRMLTNQKKVGSEKSVMGVCMHGFSHSPGLCPCGFKAPKPSEESPDDQFPSSVHFFKDST
jgi:hypothetical protein